MDLYEQHKRIFRILGTIAEPYISRKFNLSHAYTPVDGPVLLICNHVCAWDPLLVGVSLDGNHAYFVASEHLFRLGAATKLLERLLAPIPRRKGSTGMDTVKACLRHLQAGHSICLFAEGEQCWDGRSAHIFPATGKLARVSGATLVTFRLEGAYLSLPRWARTMRRGSVFGHTVGIYSPERLRRMTPKEINEIIERDIYEDAWDRQRQNEVRFRGKRLAEGLERALYACPHCSRIGTLQTHNDRVFCDCGFAVTYRDTGFLNPAVPFETLADWDAWQSELLHGRAFPYENGLLFTDGGLELTRIMPDHSEQLLEVGVLRQYEDRLVCGEHSFSMAGIHDMAMVQASLLMFSYHGEYYQLRTRSGVNLRKYLEIWKEK